MSNALELALDALLAALPNIPGGVSGMDTHESLQMKQAIAALKEAIKNQGEPVGYFYSWAEGACRRLTKVPPTFGDYDAVPVYTSAPTIPEGWQLVETKWLDAMWVAHPNLDLDIAAMLPAAPKGE